MLYRIAIEVDADLDPRAEGRCQTWVLEHPGCFAYAKTVEQALAIAPDALFDYATWIASRNQGESWLETSQIELSLEETWEVYSIDENFDTVAQTVGLNSLYEVNAWFRHDWKPLTEQDIERGLKLLEWSRADLLDLVQDQEAQLMQMEFPNERWNITGILRHVGGAEWWYLDRLGLGFPQEKVPQDAFIRLEQVRQRLVEVLPGLIGSPQVVGVYGEIWSPRKLLRRALWHERDHTFHIRKLIAAYDKLLPDR